MSNLDEVVNYHHEIEVKKLQMKTLKLEIDMLNDKMQKVCEDLTSQGIVGDDRYKIVKRTKVTRTVDVEKFAMDYPDQVVKFATISVMKLEKDIAECYKDDGDPNAKLHAKEFVNAYCDVKVTTTYDVVGDGTDGTVG